MPFESVEFRSEGHKLIGDLHCPRENAPCVLLCHGIASSKDSEKWLTIAYNLENSGYSTFRFNFRGCGWGEEWSEGDFQDTTLTARIKDYKAALDFLESTRKKVDTNILGVIGSSFGGCTIIAANDPRVKSYVALATPVRFGATPEMLKSFKEKGYYEYPGSQEPRMSRIKEILYDDLELFDMAEAVKKIKNPLLIIHGSKDSIPVNDVVGLYENANEPKKLEIIEGGSHIFIDTGHLGKVIDLSIGWFKNYL